MTRVKGCTCECTCGPATPPDLPGENWNWVAGQETRYEISDLGRVRSYVRKGPSGSVNKNARLLKPVRDKDGYRLIMIDKKMLKVHRLVLETFVGQSDLITRHLNNDRADNRLENLRWGTHLENARDRVLAGNHIRPKKTEVAA